MPPKPAPARHFTARRQIYSFAHANVAREVAGIELVEQPADGHKFSALAVEALVAAIQER